jgi:phage gp45-like
LEHFEPYGFTSRPKDPDATGQAEAVFVSIGGNNDHQIAIVVGDRRYRLKDLEKGEVALFDDQGAFVKLSSAGIIVEPAAGQNVELGAGATKGVAREGDAVSVTIPAGSFLTAATSGVLNPAPVTVSGTIQAGSLIVKASD